MVGCTVWGFFHWNYGSRSAVPLEQPPNQQCAEARALLWGLTFILNVGIREAHSFGDNAVALVQFRRCKASTGRVYQQRLLKSFRYLWASCPGFIVYCHCLRGTANPADSISRLHDRFGGNLALACEAATCRVGDLWAFSDHKTFFFMDCGNSYGSFCAPAGMAIGPPFVHGRGGAGRSSMRFFCTIGCRSW